MSWQPCDDPKPGDKRACDAIEMVIVPRAGDLGGFEVRRALPSAPRQMVGPFIFWDQMGPAEFLLGQGMDVRPHPRPPTPLEPRSRLSASRSEPCVAQPGGSATGGRVGS